MNIIIALFGYILDMLIGEPNNPFHPVRFFAVIAKWFELITRRIWKNHLKFAGFVTWIMMVSLIYGIMYLFLEVFLRQSLILYLCISSVFFYFCISTKGLADIGKKIEKSLLKGVETGRKELSNYVGRDVSHYEENDIRRAALETMSENVGDGIISPLFYFLLLGIPGMMAFKVINTMDSMFGYKNEKYFQFGYFPAKLDDFFNYIPSRIGAMLMIIATSISGLSVKNAIDVYLQDRKKHLSPNSGQYEAVAAGALGVMFGGGNYYFGKYIEKPTIGKSINPINSFSILRCKRLVWGTSLLGLVLVLLILFFWKGGELYGLYSWWQ